MVAILVVFGLGLLLVSVGGLLLYAVVQLIRDEEWLLLAPILFALGCLVLVVLGYLL